MDLLKRILTAQVYAVAKQTPVEKAPLLSKNLGNEVFLKREDMQPVFSFKLRGAFNKIAQLSSEARDAASRLESASKGAAGEGSHKCADAGGTCSCTGAVTFGTATGNKWSSPQRISGSIACNDTKFADPAPMATDKVCMCGP